MLDNLSTLHWIYIFIALGFACAIIYTNIQRTALSRFFESLISKGAFSKDSAVGLDELGIHGIYASICASSCTKKHSAGKYVIVCNEHGGQSDRLEAILDGKKSEKYYLCDCDTELINKKYSYTPLSFSKLLLMLIALIAAVLITAAVTDFIIDEMRTSDIKVEEKQEENNEQEKEQNQKPDDKQHDSQNTDDETKAPQSPTIPTGPSLPTGPKN